MAHHEQLVSDSSSDSSLNHDPDSSSDDTECDGSTWRFMPRYTAQEKGKALASEQSFLRSVSSVCGVSDEENPAGGSPRLVRAFPAAVRQTLVLGLQCHRPRRPAADLSVTLS